MNKTFSKMLREQNPFLTTLFIAAFLVGATLPVPAHATITVVNGWFAGGSPVPTVPTIIQSEAYTYEDPYFPGNNVQYDSHPIVYQTLLTTLIDNDGYLYHDTNADSQTFGMGQINWQVHAGSDTNQGVYKTGGRVCRLADTTSTATWPSTGSYGSPDNNKLVRFGQNSPYNVWQKANANNIGNSYIERIICRTDALPANSLSASPTTINSGSSSVLSFDVGANALAQGTSCTATNFTIPTHEKYYANTVGTCMNYDLEGNCIGFDSHLVAESYSPAQYENDTSGLVTVSPTVTTTYTYSCTNGNGTTNRTATVTVVPVVPPPATVASFAASPTSIASGASSALSWTSTNATSCSSANFATGGATSGTVSVSPALTTTYSISCTGAGGSSAVSYATVTVTGTKDLSAGVVTPTTATAGTAVTFSSTISNNGTGSTGAGFTNTFEVDADADHSVITTSVTDTSPTLAASATDVSTVSHTPASAGTWYVRTCADSTGAIAESNESNNCGAWTTVTVSPPPSADLTAANGSVSTSVINTPVTLTGTVSNIGTVAAGTFPNVVQICNDPDCATINTNGTLAGNSIASLAAGASQTVSASYTPTSSTQLMYRICANVTASWSNVASESNYGNNCSAWKSLAVTTPSAANLTAGTVTPTSATVGTAVTLSSTVTNSGSASTGTGFTNLFQRATNASGTGATDIGTHASTALATSGSNSATLSYTFPSAATWYVRACADKSSSANTGTIAESNESDNCSAWTAVTVSAPSAANLTTDTVTPTSATAGTAVTISAVVRNTGSVSTGTTFTDVFQTATSAAGAGATVIGTFTNPTLAAGGSGAATRSYTFPTAGTTYVRVCADNNASFTGTITESNEGDNCSAWTAVTVDAASAGICGASESWDTCQSVYFGGQPDSLTCSPQEKIVLDGYASDQCQNGSYSTVGYVSIPQYRCVADAACTATGPNLTAANIAPTSAVAGTAVTLSSTVTNNGNASTGTTFTDVFQTATSAAGAGATVIGTFTNPTLAAGGSGAATRSYTFPTAGTTYVRVCADNNASFTGTITESNEGDNCSAWTPVTVTASGGACNFTNTNIVFNWGTGSHNYTPGSEVYRSYGELSVDGSVLRPWSATVSVTNNGVTKTLVAQCTTNASMNSPCYIQSGAQDIGGNSVSLFFEVQSYVHARIDCSGPVAGVDLTAGAVTPIDAYSGTATTLSAIVTNNGTVSSGSGFTDVFQVANDASGSGATVIGTFANPARAAGTSGAATLSHTFSTTGLKYVRVCADNNASMVGTITEANEGNNCGAWTEISVTSPATGSWVGQGCGEITQSYNASCNKWAEPLDLTCPAGQRLDFQDTSCPIATNNGQYKRAARCVVDAACSAPPPSAACVINATVGVNVPATSMVQRGSNQQVQVDIIWGDGSNFVTSGMFSSGSCYPAWNPGCNGSYDTNLGGSQYGNQHIYTVPGTYEMVAEVRNGFLGGEVISLNGTWSGDGASSVSCTVNVAGPNLVSGAITPTTATTGAPVSLSGIVTNNGAAQTGATGTTFTDVYQTATSAAGAGAAVIGTATHSRLAAGASSASTLSYTFPTVGTTYVRICADNNASFVGTVAESNELDNCGAWTAVTVTGANLTAASPTPTSATVGVAVTLSSIISNVGSSSTGTTFTDVFQRANDASGTGAVVIGTFTNPIRTAGSSGAATLSYTFPTPGISYVRVCADNNASFVGSIPETNEGDNCSGWTAVNVNGPNLTAGPITPITATAGVPVTLTSTVSNGGSVSTGTTFTDVFQTATDASGAGATVIGTFTNPIRPANSSGAATLSYVFPSGGLKYVRICADNDASFVGTIAETSELDNCGAWTAVNVTPGVTSGPDLVASNPSPTTAVAGTSRNFTSTVTNAGVATTGTGFTNVFQFDNDTDHNTVTATDTDVSPVLIAGATDVTVGTYTFPTSGSWYVRTCVDNDQYFTSDIAEGNEGNNCSAWVSVTVSGPAGAGVTACSVNPTSIVSGGSATWSATPNTLGTYTWAPSEGGAPGGTGATLVRSYTGTNATFGMTVTAGGSTVNCPNLSVGGSPFGPADPTVVVSPPRVVPGGTATLTINATGVDVSCVISGPGITTRTVAGVGGSIPTTVITTTALNNQSTYTVNCDDEGPVKTIVNLIPAVQEF